MRTILFGVLALTLALPANAFASASDTVAVADPAAREVTALDGTLIWVSGEFGAQRLMRRTPDGAVSAVKGAPLSRSYRAIDLGRDRDGRLRLTYERCDVRTCKLLWNDLDGRRASFRNLAPAGCQLTTPPSVWRARIAYGLDCSGTAASRRRAGLYVKNGANPPRRLPRPAGAVKHGIRRIGAVDLRGLRVAAIADDIWDYSFSQTVAGRDMRAFLSAASEGDSDSHTRGLAIASDAVHLTLATHEHLDDPFLSVLTRQDGGCRLVERLFSPPGVREFQAIDVAVDGGDLYLVQPGAGIVRHAFVADPAFPCS